MDKPNLNTCSRDELLALYATATAKLRQIAEAVSSQTRPPVFTLKGRSCGQTTALVLKLTEENVANNAKLQKVTSILDGDDMSGTEWECAQAIADVPDVDAVRKAFSDDPTGDQGVMIVRAVLRATPQPAPTAVPPIPKVTSAMKARFIGDFFWDEEAPYYDEDGVLHDHVAQRVVPWDLCKRIYKEMAGFALANGSMTAPAAQEVAGLVEALKLISRDAKEMGAAWVVWTADKAIAAHQSRGANS